MNAKDTFDFLTSSGDPRITTKHDLANKTTTVFVNDKPAVICFESGEQETYEFVEE